MDGVLTRLMHVSLLIACGIALLASPAVLGDCMNKEADGHSYLPGDPNWVGHTEQELHAALGTPSFKLGKPYLVTAGPGYLIDVYTAPQPASPGCVDAYKINACGVITGYFCR